jgi:hypothetical protein
VKKILTLALLTLSFNAFAIMEEGLPPGPHTRSLRIVLNTIIPAHSEDRIDTTIIPFDGMSVWESYKVCLTTTEPDEHLTVVSWLKNMVTAEYYNHSIVHSWSGEQCTPLETWSNHIHIQHQLRNTIKCTNHDAVPRECKASVYLIGK